MDAVVGIAGCGEHTRLSVSNFCDRFHVPKITPLGKAAPPIFGRRTKSGDLNEWG